MPGWGGCCVPGGAGVRGPGPGRVGQVQICVSEGEPGFWGVVVVVTTTEARAPVGQEECV